MPEPRPCRCPIKELQDMHLEHTCNQAASPVAARVTRKSFRSSRHWAIPRFGSGRAISGPATQDRTPASGSGGMRVCRVANMLKDSERDRAHHKQQAIAFTRRKPPVLSKASSESTKLCSLDELSSSLYIKVTAVKAALNAECL